MLAQAMAGFDITPDEDLALMQANQTLADLTARAGTLGPAIAVHFVNNASPFLLVSLPDDLSGLSLYLGSFSMGDEAMMRAWLPVDFAFMIVSWLTARLAIRR